MTNNENDKGNGAENTRPSETGYEQSTSGAGIGDKREDNMLLGGEIEEGRLRNPEESPEGSDTDKSSTVDYGIFQAWSAGLASVPQRPLEVRDYLWASELYGAPIDVYLKMRATPYTNPPNERSLMKFEAAHLVEWIIGMILRRAGILKGEEVRCEYQYPGLLKVTGRMDKLMGGLPNYDSARQELTALGLPEGFISASERVIESLRAKYPNGLPDMPMEIKSVSSFAMDSMESKKVSIKRHRVQLYHYLISGGYKLGKLVYYCRDDARVIEFTIALDSPVEKEYRERIELLTKFHGETEQPPKEQMLVWEEFGKFSKNFNIEYSNYLTSLYGFETPRDYSEVWAKKATTWNTTLNRLKTGKKMTPLNEERLTEIRAEGYNVEELIAQMPDKPVEEEVAEV